MNISMKNGFFCKISRSTLKSKTSSVGKENIQEFEVSLHSYPAPSSAALQGLPSPASAAPESQVKPSWQSMG